MKEERLQQYARQLLVCGINLQKGQEIFITASTETAGFTELFVEEAYSLGAGNVEIMYYNDQVLKLGYEKGDPEFFSSFEQQRYKRLMEYVDRGGACVNLLSSDPPFLADLDPERKKRADKDKREAYRPYLAAFFQMKFRGVMAAVPGKAWAGRLFPEASDPVGAMWEAVLKCCHADSGEAVENWRRHGADLIERSKRLNALNLRKLHFSSSNGTNLQIHLVDEPVWVAGEMHDAREGLPYYPNIPTEEVFSCPHKAGVNGRVVASLPLHYNGTIIENFSIDFKDGRVTSFRAEKGEDVLKGIIETDEGTHRLGEVALVPWSNPIRETGIIFLTTLFDENASCHLALGSGIPATVGGADRSEKALTARGMNTSKTHVDFMFGTADMRCVGTTADGKEVVVMDKGN